MRVEGLETLDYLDNLHNQKRFTEQGDALTFESEVRQPSTCFFFDISLGFPFFCNQCRLLFFIDINKVLRIDLSMFSVG